ncbi:hypothetical protein GCM10025760_33350 [Microbacterium yannicii]|uniref:Uncharacterized protein n=1 Tax=Microbacterium yannicii TaxID=671622 RepID=A0ABP9MM33_9MICO|nr:hypothetical protein [Microbacterium yannicii]MCO5951802.1 hypothetical protein [Microbacterium yannicii]
MMAELAHESAGHNRPTIIAIWGGAGAAFIGLWLMLPVALIALLTAWSSWQFEVSPAMASKFRLPSGPSDPSSQ